MWVGTGGWVVPAPAVWAGGAVAQQRPHEAIGRLYWPGGSYRHDIGWRAIAREH